jgi:fermentation-respiration switch protein FrsA (DUF1100 family)
MNAPAPRASQPARLNPSRRRARIAVLVAAVVGVGYCGLIAYLVTNQVELIFRPVRTLTLIAHSLDLRPEPVALTGARRTPLVAWLVRAGDEATHPYWIVYLHGNDATRASDGNVTRYHQLRSLGLNVLAVEYPGYADVPGEPSEAGLVEAARAAFDHLRRDRGIEGRRIAIYGWSLGSGAAVPLAAGADEAATILEGAFSSVLRRAQAEYPYLPIGLMVRHTFLSEDAIGATGSPTLFLHSPEDAIIPFSDGQRLFGRAREPKELVSLRGGHITPNLDDEDRYLQAVRDFLHTRAGWVLARPKRGVGVALRALIDSQGVQPGLAEYARMRVEGEAAWNLAEYELTHVGRRLALEERYDAAIAVLRANAAVFGSSPLVFYHLGRAYAAADDDAHAREAWQRSLRLDASAGNPSHQALAALP